MHSETDFEPFRRVIEDLCTAFDRPCTDARVRVFWEALKHRHLAEVKRAADSVTKNFKRMPSPNDLMPEQKRPTVEEARPALPQMSRYAVAANKILLELAYFDRRRGFQSIGEWEPTPEKGWGLPLRLPQSVDPKTLERALSAKRDLVRMAEDADGTPEEMSPVDFNRMCIEGFERLLGTSRAAA